MPTFNGGDNFVWIGGPRKRFRALIGFGDEAINGGLEIDERMEDAPVEPPFGEFGEEALDSIGPRTRCGREVEGEAAMTIKPGPNLGVLMGSVVIEDDMDRLVCRNLGINNVQKADELLMPVALHVASDDCPIENIQGGEQGGGSVSLIVVRHGAETPLFHGQARLGTVEGLNLAFLVDGQDDGVGGWIDVEANNITQLADEVGIVGELELSVAVGLQAMGTPDTANRAFTDTRHRGHYRRRPMGRLDRRVCQRQRHHPLGHFGPQRRDTRRTRLVAKKAINAFFHKPLLPAPNTRLGLVGPTHDFRRADTVGAQKNDGRPPHMFLGGIAVPDRSFEADTVSGTHCEGYTCAHMLDSHRQSSKGILKRTLMLGGNH